MRRYRPSLTTSFASPALRTDLIKNDIGFLGCTSASRDFSRRLAFRIAGAGEELPEAPALECHRLSAVFARLRLGIGFATGGSLFRRGFFLGDFSRVLAFGIGGARQEAAELSPLLHHGAAALFADLVCREFLSLQVLHVLRGLLQVLLELLVEISKRLNPGHLSFFDFVEFFFHSGGVLDIEDVLEVLHEHVGHNSAEFGGTELALVFLDILPILNRRQNRRVRGRTADAFLFKQS